MRTVYRLAGQRRLYHATDLTPVRCLRRGRQPGEWESTGANPEFLLQYR